MIELCGSAKIAHFWSFSRFSNPRNILWNIFCHFWGYWLIITDYFSSTFPMLNSHKKNWFFPKMVSQTRFCLFNCFLVYLCDTKSVMVWRISSYIDGLRGTRCYLDRGSQNVLSYWPRLTEDAMSAKTSWKMLCYSAKIARSMSLGRDSIFC